MFEPELVKLLANLGAFGLVAWLFIQTFRYTIPRIIREFREELSQQREDFAKEMRHQRDSFKAELDLQRSAFSERLEQLDRTIERQSIILLYHDATVRGENPEKLGSVEDMLRLLSRSGHID